MGVRVEGWGRGRRALLPLLCVVLLALPRGHPLNASSPVPRRSWQVTQARAISKAMAYETGTHGESSPQWTEYDWTDTYYSTTRDCSNSDLGEMADEMSYASSLDDCSNSCLSSAFCLAMTYEPTYTGSNCFHFFDPISRLTQCPSSKGATSMEWDP